MSKSVIFLVKSVLGNFYRHLAIFSGHTADSAHLFRAIGNSLNVTFGYLSLIAKSVSVNLPKKLPNKVSFCCKIDRAS